MKTYRFFMIRALYISILLLAPVKPWAQEYSSNPGNQRSQASISIHDVKYANMKKSGKIINDYGDEIMGESVRYLSQRIEFKVNKPDEVVTLNVKLINSYGDILRNSSSPDGFSYSFTFISYKSDELQTIEIGRWKGKFGKNYKIEIYDDTGLIYKDKVQTRGLISHVPIIGRIGGPIPGELRNKRTKPLVLSGSMRQVHPSKYELLYRQGFTGPINDYYSIEGWREVER